MSSVSGISDTGSQYLLQILGAYSQTDSTSTTNVQSTSTTSSESLNLSNPGKLFSQLKSLSESDPEKFKTVMNDIAKEIEKTAESSSDSNESSMLKKVAEGFKKAGESGDLSEALPKGPPPQGPPPANSSDDGTTGTSDYTTGGRISAYTQTQNVGQDGFSALLNIISEALNKNVGSGAS